MLKTVCKNWLEYRAKTIETKNLKKYGTSLTWGSIDTRLSKCIVEVCADIDAMTIDYDIYKKIRDELLKGGD